MYQLFHIPIKIASVFTYALLDTGAQVSVMSDRLLRKLPPKYLRQVISNKTELLRTVSGSKMEITGIYEIPIRISNHDKQLKQIFHIVPTLTEQCILGIDFISKNSVNFDGKTRKLTYKVDKNEYWVIGKLDSASTNNPP